MTESRFNAEDSQLIADLHQITQQSPKFIRSTVYAAPSDPTVKIRSWKMNEFKYYDVPSPFPTLAQGLFTRELQGEADGGQPRYQIVARGYDKSFNIGEVPWTDWSSLEAYTGPDYTLSVTSSGCTIFIAAISPSDLIVTSKYALGAMDGILETHSQAGHRQLKTHLASKGKTEEQLAPALWEKNWTAIAELCDDNFEEHVLAYPRQRSRADEIAKTGKWKGESLGGFVVRTSIVDSKPVNGPTSRDKRPPYPTGSSFVFMVTFDELDMMYRDWREITKSLLSTKGLLDDAKLPRSKMKRKETQVYLKWVRNEIKTNWNAFQGYALGMGVMATRERFLKWLDTEQGKMGLYDLEEKDQAVKNFGKTIIVPVAVPGCGKTSVSVALAHLFRFGHIQSEDVQVFTESVVNLLGQHDVVIADKNNPRREHRKELREAAAAIHPPVRLLALHWTLDLPRATIVRVCGDRICNRGDKHQVLPADKVGKSHEDIVWQFLHYTEELARSEVDAIIEMDVGEPLEAAVGRAVDGCVNILGLERPSQEQIDQAIVVAKAYAPATTKTVDQDEKNAKARAPPRYFGILAELDFETVVTPQMEQEEDIPYNGKIFWRELVSDKRVTERPHITIVHEAGLPGDAGLWELCTALGRLPASPLFSFTLGNIVWNDRVMALTVEDLELAKEPDNDADPGRETREFVSNLPAEVRESLHITVGTVNADVRSYEAQGLVEAWRKGKRTGIGSLELEGLSAKGRLRALMS